MAVARTTRTQALAVQCPKCYAREGRPCTGARGGERISMHQARHQIYAALRKLDAEARRG